MYFIQHSIFGLLAYFLIACSFSRTEKQFQFS